MILPENDFWTLKRFVAGVEFYCVWRGRRDLITIETSEKNNDYDTESQIHLWFREAPHFLVYPCGVGFPIVLYLILEPSFVLCMVSTL